MRITTLAPTCSLLFLSLAACSTSDATGDSDTDGIDPTVAGTEDGGLSSGASGSVDGSDDDVGTSGESSADSGTTCGGEQNACGGCTSLPAPVGETCNGCQAMHWACVGPDTIACQGNDPRASQWWPDLDDDGYGDADVDPLVTCDSPPAGWVGQGGDCDDSLDTVNPAALEVCNGLDDECDGSIDEGASSLCDDVCCNFELECDGVACVAKCPTTDICGPDLDTCCNTGELCFADACVSPGDDCEFTEECPLGQECAQALGKCVPADVVPLCEFVPPVGEFDPQPGCQFSASGLPQQSRDDVVATPIVLNLTDDNGDGETDKYDMPDIAFLAYNRQGDGCCNSEGTIRVVSGQCNPDGSMTHHASIDESAIAAFNGSAYTITNDSGIAAGDLDGDGVPEIVAITKMTTSNRDVQGTVAFRRTASDGSAWEVLWHNTTYPTWNVHTRGGAVISLADVDADGTPEVVVGNVVLNGQTGALVWDGTQTAAVAGYVGGIGNNGFLGPSSAVADIDLDGFLEIAAGNTVYEHDGTVKWHHPYTTNNSSCGMSGNVVCDGFNAIADFDGDPYGEVVVVRRGEVFLFDDDGTELRRMQLPVINCSRNESGPPTIADFDGDGRPEIGTASADYYVVVDWDCDPANLPGECASPWVLWRVQNEDCSSRVTGSSVFDFEGDGAAEVVYADETTMRIFAGSTGAVLFTDTAHDSHTRIEMPVIADVDGDGNAEIVIPENTANDGIVVWEDASDNWVRTRRIWNQHGYAITHITEDGHIPAVPEVNWQNERFNNWRQNVQPDGLFHAPDAVLAGELCFPTAVGESWEAEISIMVRNEGALAIAAGTPVAVELVTGAGMVPLVSLATQVPLQPGQFEVLVATVAIPAGVDPPFQVRATVDPSTPSSPSGLMNECDETNNAATVACSLPQ